MNNKDKRHVVIAGVILSPLVVGLLTLGTLTLREKANSSDAGLRTKFIHTTRVSLCLNGRHLF